MDVVKMLSKEKGIKLFQIAREVIRCSQAGKEGNCKAYPDGNVKFLYFTDEVNARGKKGRTECIARILSDWRAEGKFPQAMKRRLPSPLSIFTCNSQPSSVWMDEMFPIYASPKSSMFNASKPATRELFGNIAFEMERAGVSLFGCQAFGVHLTGTLSLESRNRIDQVRYAYEGQGENMKVWIPRRSANR